MNTHTPGPWVAGNDEGFWQDGATIEAIEEDNRRVIVCDFVHATAIDEEANGQLIMAAPDLLAACEAALIFCETAAAGVVDSEYQRLIVEPLQAAINKAKGGE